MPLIEIESLDDPRVAHYRNLKDRRLRAQGVFLAEGEYVALRLLRSTRFETISMLVARRKLADVTPIAPADLPVYVVDDPLLHQIVGFKFHTGVLGCGRRNDFVRLEDALPPRDRVSTIVVCPELNSAENLGGLIRLGAGLGIDAMILGQRSVDPLVRQSIRTSMGTVFTLPIVLSDDILRDLARLRDDWGYERVATVLGHDAIDYATYSRPRRVAVMFGNEAQGLSPAEMAASDVRVTIPMQWGTDSLNVSVSAGIILYDLLRAVR